MTERPFDLGPMPAGHRVRTVDTRVVNAPMERIFELARSVEHWPAHLSHYRWVNVRDRRSDGGGVVTMAARRPFGPLGWPVWWVAQMQVREGSDQGPAIRFRHIDGVTRGMEVEWSFTPARQPFAPSAESSATLVQIVHVWDGPAWPLIGAVAATHVIGPVFVHGIASRTLAGLSRAAEASAAYRAPSVAREAALTGITDRRGV